VNIKKIRNKTLPAICVSLVFCLAALGGCGISKASTAETDTPEPIQWCNGTYAVLTEINNGDSSLFGGMAHNSINRQTVLNALDESWEVTTKEELDEMIGSLTVGRHNPRFLQEAREYGITSMSASEFKAALEGVENREDVNYFQNMFDAYQQFGGSAIMGWDLSRAVQLCGYGYIADFYTYEDATAKALEICGQIQGTFDSWDGFFASYLYGYVYWSEDDVEDPDSSYVKRVNILKDLKDDETSPLNLDWNLDLSIG